MNSLQLHKLWHREAKSCDLDKVTASKWQNQDSNLVAWAPESAFLPAVRYCLSFSRYISLDTDMKRWDAIREGKGRNEHQVLQPGCLCPTPPPPPHQIHGEALTSNVASFGDGSSK